MTKPTANALGAKIRAYRQKQGWTQAQLAIRARADQALVSKWETGANVPGTVHTATLVRLGVLTLEEVAKAAERKGGAK